MANRLRKQKRQRKSEHKPGAKRRRPNGTKMPANSTDVEAITHICNELIDQIFNLLDLESLMNVAGTCKRLQIAAAANFGRRCGRLVVHLFSNDYCAKQSNALAKGIRFVRFILIYGPTILPFLRCFGAQISRIHVFGSKSYEIQYLNRYCADTLTELWFQEIHKETFAVENITKPFKLVNWLEIRNYVPCLGEKFSNFAYWFPNLRKLDLRIDCIDNDFTPASLPNLHELYFGGKLDSYFKKKCFERFLQANQQLRSLKIYIWDLSFSTLLDLTSKNTVLSDLKLCGNGGRFYVRTPQLLRLAKQLPNIFELDLFYYKLKVEDVITVIRQLSSLKYLRFRLKDRAEYQHLLNRLQYMIMFEAKLNELTPLVELK